MDSVNKYLSSESSNPLDERSPSSSLPITHKFFPIHSVDEEVRHPHITDYGEDATMGEVSTNQAWLAPPLDLFKDSDVVLLRKLVVCIGKMINTVTFDIYR
jgi:hypothetical protein